MAHSPHLPSITLCKNDSYIELRQKGLGIKPVIIWFDISKETANNLLEKQASHVDPVFSDIMLDACVLSNNGEKTLLASISNARFGIVIQNGVNTILEMTHAARRRLKKIHEEYSNKWREIDEIRMEGIREMLKEAVTREYKKCKQPVLYQDEYSEETYEYKRCLNKTISIVATHIPNCENEYEIRWEWRGSRYQTLHHLFYAVKTDMEIIGLIA
jgi:hypothetical protein